MRLKNKILPISISFVVLICLGYLLYSFKKTSEIKKNGVLSCAIIKSVKYSSVAPSYEKKYNIQYCYKVQGVTYNNSLSLSSTDYEKVKLKKKDEILIRYNKSDPSYSLTFLFGLE